MNEEEKVIAPSLGNEDEEAVLILRRPRPTIMGFETKEEAEEFVKWATSREKTNSPGLNRLRRLLKNRKGEK